MVLSYEFGVSPGIIELEIGTGMEKCADFIIYADNQIFSIEDKWAVTKGNDIRKYNLNSSDVNITARYNSDVFVEDEKRMKACFSAEKRGMYYGVLIVEPYEKNAEIGIWVNLDVGDAPKGIDVNKKSSILTENAIEDANESVIDYSEEKDYSKIIFIELDFMFLLGLILCFMLMKLNKIKGEANSY